MDATHPIFSNTTLVLQNEQPRTTSAHQPVPDILEDWLQRHSENTRRAYAQDLQAFQRFLVALGLEINSTPHAVAFLLSRDHGEANRVALKFRNYLEEAELAPKTINRHLSALRSIVELANRFGHIPWKLSVANVKSRPYRDTRGPGAENVRRMIAAQATRRDPKGRRDLAILHLLYGLGLRRGEIVGLDLRDLDLDGGILWVLGKGKREREALTVPDTTRAVLRRWVDHRGSDPGPLFTNFDRARKGSQTGRRLTGRNIYSIVRSLGQELGIKATPHGIRHSAVTFILDETNGNLRMGQAFSRHESVETLKYYDDNRKDLRGKAASIVAAGLQTGGALDATGEDHEFSR